LDTRCVRPYQIRRAVPSTLHPLRISEGVHLPVKAKRASKRFGLDLKGGTAHGNTAERVTDVLREAILSGAIPASSWLREEELAEELGVSRTPVREALRRLAIEELVVKTANQGTIVAPMTMEDVLAVYVVRERLEGIAARLAASRATPELIDGLQGLQRKMEEAAARRATSDLVRLNVEFHRLIRQAAGNRYLDRFLLQVEHAVRRFPRSTYAIPSRAEAAIAEHQAIIDAIAAGDASLSEQRAIEHMREARELRTRMLLYDT
jgi:DNA-binding GntR family transcriptional regulator